ncbi:TonB-dependent receptor [Pseudoxanthomonas broegbernensis]|uniref:TonB-dependent receptor n=1 Tax=Pseudoxanthomonas broegbernensis TaxID=83619 RepID=A0A7V8GN69_9GAMM|nr:TonB-dependent receptor [Pseudoxanthomonas broegbernensis]KAF1686896.1 TonB-dependent receptor [Pseudoxanthomonas broegbernensis]MBB6065510.1 TonB-dependent receptor [Pseudoxanthomonas broegbernensis]
MKKSQPRKSPLAASIAAAVFGLAAALPAMAQDAAPRPEEGAVELDRVVVRGVRGAQASAINAKREAHQIVDSISAEDIGKLPDVTIADSLQRITGVQLRRSAGEGALVNIRGVPQVQTTMNGELYLGAGGGDQYGQPNLGRAQPDFVDIPPTLFSGVDVVKSLTAADLDGGIGGTISLKTHRPFDFQKGWTFSAQAEGSYGDMVEKLNEQYSALANYRSDRWGALLTVSYSDASLANKRPSVWSNGAQKSSEENVGFDFNGDGAIGGNFDPANRPREYFYNWVATELENRYTERERLGVNAALEFAFTDSLKLNADVAYTDMQNLDKSVAAQLHTSWATNQLQPGSVVDPNGVLEYGIFNYGRFQAHSLAGVSDSDALNANIELAFDNGGAFRGSLRYVHGKSKRVYEEARADAVVSRGDPITLPDGSTRYANINGLERIDASIDFRGAYPRVDMITDVTDPENWQLMSTWAQGNRMEATMDVFRGDGVWEFQDGGVLRSLQFGARYGERDYDYRAYKYLSPVSPGPCADPNLALYYYKDPLIVDSCTGVSEARLLPFSSIPDYWARFGDFNPVAVDGLGGVGLPAVDPNVMSDPVKYLNSLYPGNVAYAHAPDSFAVKEQSTSGYFQANLEGETGANGIPWYANLGVRVVNTKLTIDQYLTADSVFVGSHSWNGVNPALGVNRIVNEYTDVLPSANISFDLSDEQKLRFGYNKGVARQNLPDLGRGLVVFYAANGSAPDARHPELPPDAQIFLNGRAGNPDLEPFRSSNYNMSWEWYFADASLLNLGVFLMDVESFPGGTTQNEPQPDADGVVRDGGPVERIVNGGGGTIKGFEIGYQQAFDFLPGWWSGLGVNLNYTYSDAATGGEDIDGNVLPIGDNSKHQANAVVWYQKDKVQARVAYNWRSKRFGETNSAAWGDQLAIWNDEVGYLDASLSYDVNPHFTLYLQGTNLTGENERRYAQWSNQFYDMNIYERRYYLGARFRF